MNQEQAPTPAKPRKIMIIIEDDGRPNGFNVYVTGDKERIGKIPEQELTATEWWGARIYAEAVRLLRESGAVRSETVTS